MINPQQKKNPAAAAWIGRCPSTAALSLMVKVGKMFVCIETVVRVARRARAAAGSVASRVRAMFLRKICSAGNEIDRIHVDFRKAEMTGTRVDGWLWRCQGPARRATLVGTGRLSFGEQSGAAARPRRGHRWWSQGCVCGYCYSWRSLPLAWDRARCICSLRARGAARVPRLQARPKLGVMVFSLYVTIMLA